MQTINSYGIACVRKRQEYEILMIKRKCTYSYLLFILGHYTCNFEMQTLVRGMTITEKNILLGGNFQIAYFHAFCVTRDTMKNRSDQKGYDRLEKIFYNNNIDRLKTAATGSSIGTLQWEFPKGRKKESENDLVAATREFEEETGIRKYKIINHIKPFSVNIHDGGVHYKYFIYTATSEEEPVYSAAELNYEISEIIWVPSSSAVHILTGEIFHVYKNIIKALKKHRAFKPEIKKKLELFPAEIVVN
jgi:8-oxo-dGTP pyrophosphatase MutT (NUDIX family)